MSDSLICARCNVPAEQDMPFCQSMIMNPLATHGELKCPHRNSFSIPADEAQEAAARGIFEAALKAEGHDPLVVSEFDGSDPNEMSDAVIIEDHEPADSEDPNEGVLLWIQPPTRGYSNGPRRKGN